MDATIPASLPCETIDGSSSSLAALIDHIVSKHHAYLRTELVTLGQLAARCDAESAQGPQSARDLRQILAALTEELIHHMHKEECVLFPWIRQLEENCSSRMACGGTVAAPIHVMREEHEFANQALSRLRWLTADFTPAVDSSDTYRCLVGGLAALDVDLRQHIHEENDLLFPRALALESAALAHV
jgi:regulator of cell morphogenesis and NO signaling